jgi:hypothetical protein
MNTPTQFEGAVKPDAIAVDGYEAELSAARITDIPSNMQVRLDYDGAGYLTHLGFAPHGLPESDTHWLLHKIMTSGGFFTKRLIAYDSWDNHLTATYS